MVGRPATGIAASGLLSPGVQRATQPHSSYLAEQESALQAIVRGQCRNAPGGCRRPETHWRGDRVSEYSPYMGPDSAGASPYSLRRARRWTVTGSSTLDSRAQPLLPASESTEPGLSRQVCGWTAARLSPRTAGLFRN